MRSTSEGATAFPGDPVAYTSVPGEAVEAVTAIDAPWITVELPPAHRADLVLELTDPIRPPRHQRAQTAH